MRCLLACAVLLAGCDGGPDDPGTVYAPEMFESVAYDAHDPNPVLPHGMTLQSPPEGTIPRGYTPVHYGPGAEEATAAAALTSPVEVTDDAIARGQVGYETFCAICHGHQGDGDGAIVPPFPNPPSLKAARATDMPDGQLFHVITHGQGFMPSYAAQVPADDRWRIVMYVRRLQGVEPDPAARAMVAPPPDAPLPTDAGELPTDAAGEETTAADASVLAPTTGASDGD